MTEIHEGDNLDTEAADDDFDAFSAFQAYLSGDADKEAAPKASTAEDDPDADEAEDAEAQAEPSDDAEADDEDDESSDDADEDGEATGEDQAPKVLDPAKDEVTVTVKVGDTTESLSLRELSDGYLRRADYSRKTAEVATARKEVEAERQSVRGDREAYATLITALETKLTQLDAPTPDWEALYQANPHEYVRQKELHREREDHLRAVATEKARIEQERAKETAAARTNRMQETWQAAVEAMPAWRDDARWSKDRDAIMSYAKASGFSPEEINAVCSTDARVLLAMHHAAQHQRLMANKPRPAGAKEATTAVRSTSKAVAPRPVDDTTRAKARLRETGRVHDAAKLFERLLK